MSPTRSQSSMGWAATARVHDLTLATRNIKDVRQTEVDCINPSDSGA